MGKKRDIIKGVVKVLFSMLTVFLLIKPYSTVWAILGVAIMWDLGVLVLPTLHFLTGDPLSQGEERG